MAFTTEELLNLGLTEEQAKEVFALHGKDLNANKSALETITQERDSLKSQLQNTEAQLETLKSDANTSAEQKEALDKSNIMDAKEALSILSDIARGKRDEEVLMLNPVTGKVERHTKKADNATVIKAITEILKRYPTTKQSEKLELELAKLKAQLNTDNDDDDEIIIIDDQADELEGLIDDL